MPTRNRHRFAGRLAVALFLSLSVPLLASLAPEWLPMLGLAGPAAPPSIDAAMTATLATDDDGDGKADPNDVIRYTATITNTGDADALGTRLTDVLPDGTSFVAGSLLTSPRPLDETYQSVGNMTLTSSSIAVNCGVNPLRAVTCNDTTNGGDLTAFGDTEAHAGDVAVNGTNTVTTVNGGTVTLNTSGTFVYMPAAGFSGTDTFWYQLTRTGVTPNLTGTAKVSIVVGGANGMAWFIGAGAGGGGTQASPIDLSAFQAKNALASPSATDPHDGDTVFLFEGFHTGTMILRAGQELIGQDVTTTVAALGGAAPQPGNAYPGNNFGPGAVARISGSGVDVVLNSGNTLAGFTAGDASTIAIQGDAVGALKVRDVVIDNASGGGLEITTSGTLTNAAPFTGFTTVNTSGGTKGVRLAGVAGSIALGTGNIDSASGPLFEVVGGSVSVTYSGNISQNFDAPLLWVSQGHTGTLTLDSVSANNGPGILFDNADGAYNFPGGALNMLFGNDSGVAITNGSSGSFAFGAGAKISTTGSFAFNVTNSDANITYSGNINKLNPGAAITIDNHDAGTITFDTGTFNGSSNTGGGNIVVQNCNGGTINFNQPTKTLTTTSATAVRLANNTGASINFGNGGLAIITTTAPAFDAAGGGTVTVTGSGNTINSSSGRALNVSNTDIGGGGLVFRSISSGNNTVAADPVNGIVLNNTGSTAGLTVTGDGATTAGLLNRNGSGGTIQNTTGDGVSLTNAYNVTLRQMTIKQAGLDAVESSGGGGIVLSAVDLDSPGWSMPSAGGDGFGTGNGWRARNITGVNAFDNNSRVTNFQSLSSSGLLLQNTDTSFTSFTVDHALVTSSSTGGNGVSVSANGTTVGAVTLTSSEFTGLEQLAADIRENGSGTLTAVVQKNSFHDANEANFTGRNGLRLALPGNGQLNFTVGGPTASDGNTFHNLGYTIASNGVVRVEAPTSFSTGARLNGSIQHNNLFNDVGFFLNGTRAIDIQITADAGSHGGHSILVADNTINAFYKQGINLVWQSLNGGDVPNNNFTIRNNTILNVGIEGNADSGSAIELETATTSTSGVQQSANVLIQDNVATNNNGSGVGSTLDIVNGPLGSNASVLNLTLLGNTFENLNTGGTAKVAEIVNTTSAAATICLNLNSNGASPNNVVGGNGTGFQLTSASPSGTFAIEGLGASTPTAFLGPLNQSNGASPATITASGTFVSSAGCAGSSASLRMPARDPFAAPPQIHGEPAASPALSPMQAWSRFDDGVRTLASIGRTFDPLNVMSWAGRHLAAASRSVRTAASGLMAAMPSVRAGIVTLARHAIGGLATPLHAFDAPLEIDIGTVPAGKAVTVVFRARVNAPPLASYSNHATIESSAGSFADVDTNTVTTAGDRYDTITTLQSSANPVDIPNPVTFTATVTPVEGAGLTPGGTVQFKDGGVDLGSVVTCADAGGNTCTAQLITSALTQGTHDVTAAYSGGINHDPSVSGALSQVVNVCVVDPVVINANDGGPGSLRQAVADACTNSTITFDGALPVAIALTSGPLVPPRDLVILGPGAKERSIGAIGSRVLTVDAGRSVTLSGLSLSGGEATQGGVLYNRGTLNLTEVSVSGGQATDGGGVFNDADGVATVLNVTSSLFTANAANVGGAIFSWGVNGGASMISITNSTFSGNTANDSGGAIANVIAVGGAAPLVITGGTITGNRADADGVGGGSGGGVYLGGTVTTVLRNTIVAGNHRGDSSSTAADDIDGWGVLDSSTASNLIGNGDGAIGISNGVSGNRMGSAGSPIDPRLGPLADNGGPTMTHALLIDSPALDAGDDSLSVGSVDQRGVGYARKRDAADADTTQTVDIGALEQNPAIADIGDKSTVEDTPLAFSFDVGDGSGLTSVAATSDDTDLIPNANLMVTGSGSTRTLTITPAANQFGAATITVTATVTTGGVPQTMSDTFELTVASQADVPAVTAAATLSTKQTTSGLVVTRNAGDGAEVTRFRITNIANGLLFKSDGVTPIGDGDFITIADGSAGLKFTPDNGDADGSFDVEAAFAATTAGISPAATALITVSKHTTSTSLTSHLPNPSFQNEPVIVTYSVTSATGSPTGNVVVTMGDGPETCTGTVAEGQCTISLTVAGAGRQMTAAYQGTADFAISADTAAHQVNACTANPVVLSIADTGTDSLREALASVCPMPGSNVITFNLGSTPTTISLTSSELWIGRDVVIQGPGARKLNVARFAGSPEFRIFHVAPNVSATISGVTISSGVAIGAGDAGHGAGIFADRGSSLTLREAQIELNIAAVGGGVAAITDTSDSTVLIERSSISNNTATDAGGVFAKGAGATVNLTMHDSTVSGNHATAQGGGVSLSDDVVAAFAGDTIVGNAQTGFGPGGAGLRAAVTVPPLLHNTIVAKNTSDAWPTLTPDDVAAALDPRSSHNLIGADSGATGLVNGVNGNQIGNAGSPIDPLLGPLQDNGGASRTHALLIGSPAIDAGSNALVADTTDQRGTDFGRIKDGPDAGAAATVDIGAFEVDPTIGNIPDQTTAEDTPLVLTFDVGDGATGSFLPFDVAASDPTLVPDGSIVVTGTGSTRTLTVTPAPNRFGATAIGVTVRKQLGSVELDQNDVFQLTVTPVADTPSLTNATTLAQVQTTSGLVISPNATDGPEVTHVKVTNIQHGALFLNDGTTPVPAGTFVPVADGAAGLKFTPADGFTGIASFDVQASTAAADGGLGGDVVTAAITVNPHAATTTLVSANPNPSDRTQPITVVYSVTSGGPAPTGTVTVSISGGSETCTGTVADGRCTLVPTISGTRDIQATYSGDDITAGSASATLSHSVLDCTTNPVVTSALDDGSPGTLRGAVGQACSGSTISFALPDPNPTIVLGGTEIAISESLTIAGGDSRVRISGNHVSRVFNINGPDTSVTLDRLTIVDGSSDFGGAIFSSATLRVTNSTFSANHASTFGGAILTEGHLTVLNSTLDGNTSDSVGGAIMTTLGSVSLTNVTITGNSAGNSGGGVLVLPGAGVSITITNSIIAGNTALVGPQIFGDYAGDHNITSDDAGLGPLQDNGGPTPTRMPLPDSPAIDAGDNAAAAAAGLTTDQRGVDRVLDSADPDAVRTVDIGAVEAYPGLQQPPDRTFDEDTSIQVTFDVGDTSLPFESIIALSSGWLLPPSGSVDLTTGSGSTRTLTLAPAANAFGTTAVTIVAQQRINGVRQTVARTFNVTVNDVNDPPAMDPIADVTIAEDPGQQTVDVTGISAGAGESEILGMTATSNNTAVVPNPSVSFNGTNPFASLRFTPVANKSGTATVTVTLTDGSGATAVRTFTVTVAPVPDAPFVSMTFAREDTESFPFTIARNSRDGADVTHFKITNVTGGTLALFDSGRTPVASGQFISVAQGTGQLVFTPSPNSNVTGHFTVQASLSASDAGLGGPAVTADITVDPVPDAPTVTGATTAEDTQTTSGLVVTRNVVDGADVASFRIVQIVNGTLFKSDGTTALANGAVITAAEGASGLRFTPAPNFRGGASIQVIGIINHPMIGPIEGEQTGTGAITVTPVADTPSITNASTIVNAQTTSGLVVSPNAADGAEVTHFKVAAVSGGQLFLGNGVTPVPAGSFITSAQGIGGLRFTPATDSIVTGHVSVRASTSASDAGVAGGTVTADIAISPMPSATTVTTSKTPANPGETVTFTATVAPSQAAASGTVQFKDGSTNLGSPVALASGSASFATSSLTAGLHTITAVYSGNMLAATSTGTLTGGQRVRTPVTLSIASSGNPTPLGQPVTITATPAFSGGGTPTGTMTFKDGATTLGSPALSGGAASFTTSAFTLGVHHLTVEYGGDGLFVAAGGTFDQTTSCPVMTVGPSTVPAATAGVAYSQTFTQSGGAGAIVFSMTGTAPAGLTFTAATATLSGTPTAPGSYDFQITATPANGCGAVSKSYTLLIGGGRAVLTGADAGAGPHVRRFNALDGSTPSTGALTSFFPFNHGFTGGVRVAEGDVNGDGVPDPIAAAGSGGAPEVRVYDGATGTLLRSVLAFETGFTGGVFVAAADVDGDGYADVIAGSGPGRSGEVKVFSGRDGAVLRDVVVFAPAFTGGVRVAAGDVNGDGNADLVVGTGPGTSSTVTILNGRDLSVLRSFSPYGAFPGGVFVAAGDVTGDGLADVITGADAGGGPHVQVFDGATGAVAQSFFAFAPTFTGGVRVAAGDVTGDGKAEVIVGAGPGGTPEVRVFDGATAALVSTQLAYPSAFPGGLFVATVVPQHRLVIERAGSGGGAGAAGAAAEAADRRPNMIAGWAFVENTRDAGISAVHVYARPVSGGAAIFLGVATLGDARPDVAERFGQQYANAGFHLAFNASLLPLGNYDIVVFAQAAQTGTFEIARTVRFTRVP